MKVIFTQDIESCNDCFFYVYFRCYGNDCTHPDVPNERGDEPLAENRKGFFPIWCPYNKRFNSELTTTVIDEADKPEK